MTGRRSTPSTPPHSPPGPATTASPGCARSTTRATTARSCSTRTATTSRPSATSLSSTASRTGGGWPAVSGIRGAAGSLARMRVISPADSDYDTARQLFSGAFDKRPSTIARVSDANEISTVIEMARDQELELTVRSGGHSGAGHSSTDGGIVLDLTELKGLEIDTDARTAWAQTGLTAGEYTEAAHEHGLATGFGDTGSVGIGGITLGGGVGFLVRKYGMTIDDLLAAEIVTADGELVRASADEHPDLFWAIRGGGGNFGVVTSFVFRLHEVPGVIAGPTLWSIEDSAEVLKAYRDFLPQAPRELNGFFAFLSVPPGPPFPEELHLRKVCGVVWCYAGADEQAAAAAMKPLLDALPEPLLHGPGAMPHAALQGAFDGVYPAGDHWYWRADFVNEIPDEAVAEHVKWGAAMPTWQSTMHLYPIDGAAQDVD